MDFTNIEIQDIYLELLKSEKEIEEILNYPSKFPSKIIENLSVKINIVPLFFKIGNVPSAAILIGKRCVFLKIVRRFDNVKNLFLLQNNPLSAQKRCAVSTAGLPPYGNGIHSLRP